MAREGWQQGISSFLDGGLKDCVCGSRASVLLFTRVVRVLLGTSLLARGRADTVVCICRKKRCSGRDGQDWCGLHFPLRSNQSVG